MLADLMTDVAQALRAAEWVDATGQDLFMVEGEGQSCRVIYTGLWGPPANMTHNLAGTLRRAGYRVQVEDAAPTPALRVTRPEAG